MKPENGSIVTTFILEGFAKETWLQVPLFIIFILINASTLLGNVSILMLIRMDPHLHTPMYFFLGTLAVLDFWFSSTISPKMLFDMLTERKVISYFGCLTQLFFYFLLLAMMAYDRNVAICKPLHYSLKMTKCLTIYLVAVSYFAGFLNSLIHAVCFIQLSFCGPNIVDHFMCDFPVLMHLTCTNITRNELVRIVCTSFVLLVSLLIVLISYAYIILTVLKIRTSAGRYRAFSNCISHFISVFLFYGSVFFIELRPSSNTSVFSTIIIPLLNPPIYSLRNQEIKKALKKMLRRSMFFH
ncbi:olfactory receptor 9G4-like [Lissotriton helveticus]